MLISVKSLKFKIVVAVFLALIISGIVASVNNFASINSAVSKFCGRYNINVMDNKSRIDFLGQFNLKVTPEPIETAQINIPAQFNKVYENYNKMQKEENGLNLEPYKGKTCTKYTYGVLNYAGKPDGVLANIFVFEDKVIAGDVCSLEIDGFMHGFAKNISEEENTEPKVTYRINKVSAVNSKAYEGG